MNRPRIYSPLRRKNLRFLFNHLFHNWTNSKMKTQCLMRVNRSSHFGEITNHPINHISLGSTIPIQLIILLVWRCWRTLAADNYQMAAMDLIMLIVRSLATFQVLSGSQSGNFSSRTQRWLHKPVWICFHHKHNHHLTQGLFLALMV